MKSKQIIPSFLFLLFFPVLSFGQDDIKTPEPWISGVKDGHEYADLGLPSGTLWATCNLGADTYTEIGGYYAWGETETKDNYIWETYEFFSEFVVNPEWGSYVICQDIGEDICGTEYDAARVNWGGAWRMPNYAEIKELRRTCWWKMVRENGVLGYRFFGPNTNSIFMPFTGGMSFDFVSEMDAGGYWCGTECHRSGSAPDSNSCASLLYFDTGTVSVLPSLDKDVGHIIRPVFKRGETGINDVLSDATAYIVYSDCKISIHSCERIRSLEIWSINGSKLLSETYPQQTVDVSQLKPGTYIVRLCGEKKTITTQKLLIK